MRRPSGKKASGIKICALIPARDEEKNLATLLPSLVGEVDGVYVYNDHSSDKTGEIARSLGASVIEGDDLPKGWTGKNNACHRLGQSLATQARDDVWWVFLDADTRPRPGFRGALESLIAEIGTSKPVITGFTKMLPGRGLEPVYMSWVPWILLATCPFGLICRLPQNRWNHPRFTNGQFVLWRSTSYLDLLPNEAVKGAVLEDVAMGRWLAQKGVPVEVVDISGFLGVQMYENLEAAHEGMKKNSFEITGSLLGSWGLALLFLFVSIGWLLPWGSEGAVLIIALLFSRLMSGLFAGHPLWTLPLFPLTLVMAAHTVLESAYSRLGAGGGATWKGRRVGQVTLPEEKGSDVPEAS